jgi:hypothetical protein
MGVLKIEPLLQCGEAPQGETQYLENNKHHCLVFAAIVSYEHGLDLNCINHYSV